MNLKYLSGKIRNNTEVSHKNKYLSAQLSEHPYNCALMIHAELRIVFCCGGEFGVSILSTSAHFDIKFAHTCSDLNCITVTIQKNVVQSL